MSEEHSDDLLKRALIDAEASASVALRVAPLTLSEQLTVVFHGRKDLGTIQTYIAHGGRGAGDALGKDELMRVPCDLDLAAAEDREEAEHLFAEQAGALRDALVGADTVLPNLRLAQFAVPGLDRFRVVRPWTGFEANVPDFYPLAGAAPGVPDAFLLGCVRGGYTIGPCIGRLMGDFILGRQPGLPLFDPARSYETERLPA